MLSKSIFHLQIVQTSSGVSLAVGRGGLFCREWRRRKSEADRSASAKGKNALSHTSISSNDVVLY
jgi:hypothetical protein